MKTKIYRSDHQLQILAELNKERKSSQNTCDVTLIAGSHEFAAHRCILVAFSPFFKKLFSCEMKEKYENKANVKGIDEKTMETILDFIYACCVEITSENVYSLLEAANFLDIKNLRDYSVEFLLDEIDSDNCLSMRSYAKLYSIDELAQKVDVTIKENFEAVIQSKEFKELEFEEISKMMRTEEKQSSSEEIVFHALIRWINHKPTTRHGKLNKAFDLLNIDQLSLDFLQNVVAKESLVMTSIHCTKLCFLSSISPERVESIRESEVSLGNVGMEDGRLPDSSITASSSHQQGFSPKYARLNNQPSGGHYGCWIAGPHPTARAGEYIQIDLGHPTRVIGVVTQGRPTSHNQCLTGFNIAYGNATNDMQTIQESGSAKVFKGNNDMNCPVTNLFPKPITARYFRLIVQTWNNYPALRMELLTC